MLSCKPGTIHRFTRRLFPYSTRHGYQAYHATMAEALKVANANDIRFDHNGRAVAKFIPNVAGWRWEKGKRVPRRV